MTRQFVLHVLLLHVLLLVLLLHVERTAPPHTNTHTHTHTWEYNPDSHYKVYGGRLYRSLLTVTREGGSTGAHERHFW